MKRSRLIAVILILCVALIAGTVTIVAESARKASSTESEKSGANEGTEQSAMKLREIALENGIKAEMTIPGRSMWSFSGRVVLDLPEKTVEISCDNEYLYCDGVNHEIDSQYTSKDKMLTVDGVSKVSIRGKTDKDCALESTNTTLRLIIKEDDMIVGYALVCFWEPFGLSVYPKYNCGEVVKAVLFENPDKANVTVQEVNALLDKAYQELVVDAALFETRSDNCLRYDLPKDNALIELPNGR